MNKRDKVVGLKWLKEADDAVAGKNAPAGQAGVVSLYRQIIHARDEAREQRLVLIAYFLDMAILELELLWDGGPIGQRPLNAGQRTAEM